MPHRINTRGINIEGAHVQWGDGSTHRFFLPANAADSYINIHRQGTLAFDYDGPVTLRTPISGGVFHDSLSTPADADISVLSHPGNDVTFAVPQNYHGTTTIGAGAVLRLGSGAPGGDGSVLTGGAADRIVDDGQLVLQNRGTQLTLARISGRGALVQAGRATTTLRSGIGYTGPTTVSAGTLAVAASATLSSSSGVRLTSATAVLDLSRGGDQTVRTLSGVPGSTVLLARGAILTVAQRTAAGFAGRVVGGRLAGPGASSASPSSGSSSAPAGAPSAPAARAAGAAASAGGSGFPVAGTAAAAAVVGAAGAAAVWNRRRRTVSTVKSRGAHRR
ncbi:hypothetical protein ACFQZC_35065 [Streptacidiphilus monticola]